MFLELICGHFGAKMKSLRPSYQSYGFTIFGHGIFGRGYQIVSPGGSWSCNFFLLILGTQSSALIQNIHLKYHQKVEIIQFWLLRPKNANWPINQLRKHFRAKSFLNRRGIYRIQLRSFWYQNGVSTIFLSKVSILPIFGHGRGSHIVAPGRSWAGNFFLVILGTHSSTFTQEMPLKYHIKV